MMQFNFIYSISEIVNELTFLYNEASIFYNMGKIYKL